MTRDKIIYDIKGGAEITPYFPETALSQLIQAADYENLQTLLARHKELSDAVNTPNSEFRYRTPLNQAIQLYLNTAENEDSRRRDLLRIMDILLGAGADPNITTQSGKTIYSYPNIRVFNTLLERHNLSVALEPISPIKPESIKNSR